MDRAEAWFSLSLALSVGTVVYVTMFGGHWHCSNSVDLLINDEQVRRIAVRKPRSRLVTASGTGIHALVQD
jgi:hypothetical protein